ncbi:MAG TPA: glycosyltransferase family 4 protein, partial [Polyangiaceae bacterium]
MSRAATHDGEKRKRVLFVSPFAFVGGGAERVILDHAQYLDRSRYEPFAAVLGPGTLADAFRGLGVETYESRAHSEARPLDMARALLEFGRYVDEQRIDVVVGNKHRSILYWGLSRARRRPFVWLLHDPLPQGGVLRRISDRVVERMLPDFTVWVTPVPRESYEARFPRLRSGRSSQIFPGTCPEELTAGGDAERARQRFGVPRGAPVLSVFARMQPSKGQLDLVEAAPLVLQEFPETRFLVCGGTLPGMPPEHERAVRAAIARANLGERVLLLGQVSEQEKKDVLAA